MINGFLVRVRIAAVGLTVLTALSACAPPPAPSGSTGQNPAAPAGQVARAPKNAVVINSGIAPVLDNRFVITSNNAAGIVRQTGSIASPILVS